MPRRLCPLQRENPKVSGLKAALFILCMVFHPGLPSFSGPGDRHFHPFKEGEENSGAERYPPFPSVPSVTPSPQQLSTDIPSLAPWQVLTSGRQMTSTFTTHDHVAIKQSIPIKETYW